MEAVSKMGSVGDQFPTEHPRVHIDGVALRHTTRHIDMLAMTGLHANRVRNALIAPYQHGWAIPAKPQRVGALAGAVQLRQRRGDRDVVSCRQKCGLEKTHRLAHCGVTSSTFK